MLPETRNTTYAASDPPKSNDLNALQDCVISKKHGEVEMSILPVGGVRTNVIFSSTGHIVANAPAASVAEHMVPVEEGDVLTGLAVNYLGTGAGTISATLSISKGDGTAPSTYTVSVASPAASWNRATTSTGFPRTILQNESAWLTIALSDTGHSVSKVGIIKKRL